LLNLNEMEHGLRTCLNVEEDGGLICTIYCPTEKSWEHQYLYSQRLMKLHGNEFNLNHGRFKSFRFETQKHRIVLAKDNIKQQAAMWGWNSTIIAEWVEWIADNIDTAWSVKGVASSNRGIDLEFSFADAVAAVHFTLRWR
jgi:UDP-2,3-diacylglucosamine pyrophosphatase LpxH